MRRLLFFLSSIILIVIILSCGGSRKTDFSTLHDGYWYSAILPSGSELYLKFEKKSFNEASGLAFFSPEQHMTELGTFSISGSSELTTKIKNREQEYSGKFEAGTDTLVFHMKKPEKADIYFIAHKTHSVGEPNNRYKTQIFDKVSRKTVKYGKAKGFYTTKKVKDMNSESYPEIIMSVTRSIAKNLFTETQTLNMDIYRPKGDSTKNRPLIMLIHGGAFIVGDKQDNFQVRLANYFAKMGYVVASINYRMGYVFLPGAYGNLERCIYRAVQDSRAAIRYMIHNKNKYGIDPDKIFVAGNSAGGFIALKTAFMGDEEAYESTGASLFMLYDDLGCLDCSTNDYKEKVKIDAVVNMWGALTHIDMLDSNERIPTLLIHGDSDRIVPYDYNNPFQNVDPEYTRFFMQKVYGSEPIYERLQKFDIPSKLITIRNGPHEPQFDDKNRYTSVQDTIQDVMKEFLYERLLGDTLIIKPLISDENDKSTAYFFEVNAPKGSLIEWVITDGDGAIIPVNKKQSKIKLFMFSTSSSITFKVRIKTRNGIIIESDFANTKTMQYPA
ncbi:MAG: hypothetical protein C0592_09685 [Marinilabiliales bacterium]|nr:MAG: hypothetical protein C0592_09685 [Marinilabiliales bacterium]